MNNPYPGVITGEDSGVKVQNEKHRIWQEGYDACLKENRDADYFERRHDERD